MPKQRIDIEKLLQWTYRDELPKQAVGGLTGWERLIYLGTRVDESERDRESMFPAAMGAPHPDALLVDYRVRKLPERVRVAWPAHRGALMAHLTPYLTDDDPAVKRMETSQLALVQMHARMGTRPRWDLGPVSLHRVIGKNGKQVVNGITPGRRYQTGAHCPLELWPPAATIASARFEYAAWWSALDQMARESWNLASFIVDLPRAMPQPWVTGEEGRGAVLPALDQAPMQKPYARESIRALPRPKAAKGGPVRKVPVDVT